MWGVPVLGYPFWGHSDLAVWVARLVFGFHSGNGWFKF